MSKSTITYGMVTQWFLKAITWGASNGQNEYLLCPICGENLLPGQKVQWDHTHCEGLDGPNVIDNLRLIHYDPCHKKKNKADQQALAKIDRITGITKGRPKRAWAKRKMKGRSSWPPKGSRKMGRR